MSTCGPALENGDVTMLAEHLHTRRKARACAGKHGEVSPCGAPETEDTVGHSAVPADHGFCRVKRPLQYTGTAMLVPTTSGATVGMMPLRDSRA